MERAPLEIHSDRNGSILTRQLCKATHIYSIEFLHAVRKHRWNQCTTASYKRWNHESRTTISAVRRCLIGKHIFLARLDPLPMSVAFTYLYSSLKAPIGVSTSSAPNRFRNSTTSSYDDAYQQRAETVNSRTRRGWKCVCVYVHNGLRHTHVTVRRSYTSKSSSY